MNVCSVSFLVACALAALLFHLLPGARLRQSFLSLLNLAFLVQLVPSRASGVLLAVFILGTYGFLKLVKSWPSGYVVAGAIALAVAFFVVVKKYAFVQGLLPQSFMYRTIELVGISYMLFKFIHVLVDLWQGQLEEFSFVGYANYQLAFFTLLAGPIQRYNDFNRFWSCMDMQPGDERTNLLAWKRLLIGMLKMGGLAPLAWYVFENGNPVVPGESVLPAYLSSLWFYSYPVYLYLNFSGYTDIVIGAARLFGLELPENFDRPWLARNIMDFWNRWHITLTHWIRDYVFMSSYKAGLERWPSLGKPLGYALIFLALLLAGAWHGATYGFLIFGMIHGVAVAANRAYGDLLQRLFGRQGYHRYLKNEIIHIVAMLATIHYICFSFLFFALGTAGALGVLRLFVHQLTDVSTWRLLLRPGPGTVTLLAVFIVVSAAYWQGDLLARFRARVSASSTSATRSLYGVVSSLAALATVILLFNWALENKNQVVVYMGF